MAPQQQCPGPYQASTATQQFEQAHEQGLRKKQLFKEYLGRHEVMENINMAMEALFDCRELPHDPLKFLGQALLAASDKSVVVVHGQTRQKKQQ